MPLPGLTLLIFSFENFSPLFISAVENIDLLNFLFFNSVLFLKKVSFFCKDMFLYQFFSLNNLISLPRSEKLISKPVF